MGWEGEDADWRNIQKVEAAGLGVSAREWERNKQCIFFSMFWAFTMGQHFMEISPADYHTSLMR
jgi:hypothetical protein